MNRLLHWGLVIGRLQRRVIAFLWTVAVSSIKFILRVVELLLRDLLWEELVWKWWLGYRERPVRVLVVAILMIVSTWILYWQAGTFVLDSAMGLTGQPTLQNALYYSLVSFTALGYGGWAPQPVGWAQWVGAVQAVLGIFSVVFFSIPLTLRITR